MKNSRSDISQSFFLINRRDRFKLCRHTHTHTLAPPRAFRNNLPDRSRSRFHETGPTTFHLSSSSPRVSADQFLPLFSLPLSLFSYLLCPRMDPRDLIFAESAQGKRRSLSASGNALSYLSHSRLKRSEREGSSKKNSRVEHRSLNGHFRITRSTTSL